MRDGVCRALDEVLAPWNVDGRMGRGVVLTGTPGIGKAVMTNWIVAQWMAENARVWRRAGHGGRSCCMTCSKLRQK